MQLLVMNLMWRCFCIWESSWAESSKIDVTDNVQCWVKHWKSQSLVCAWTGLIEQYLVFPSQGQSSLLPMWKDGAVLVCCRRGSAADTRVQLPGGGLCVRRYRAQQHNRFSRARHLGWRQHNRRGRLAARAIPPQPQHCHREQCHQPLLEDPLHRHQLGKCHGASPAHA